MSCSNVTFQEPRKRCIRSYEQSLRLVWTLTQFSLVEILKLNFCQDFDADVLLRKLKLGQDSEAEI